MVSMAHVWDFAKRCGSVRIVIAGVVSAGVAAAFMSTRGEGADKKLPVATDKGPGVVIVDTARVLASYKALEGKKEKLEAEIRSAEDDVARERAAVEELRRQRDAQVKGTPEYAKLD